MVGVLSSRPLTPRTSRSACSRGDRAPATIRRASAWISGSSLSMNGSGRRYSARSGSSGPGRRRRASTSSSTLSDQDWPTPSRASAEVSTPSTCRRRRTTSRGSSIRARMVGTTAAAANRVGLHPARDRELDGLLLRFAHRQQPQRALLADHLAGVGDPRRGGDAGVAQLGSERRRRPSAGDHHLAAADAHRHRRVGQRRRVEDHELMGGAVAQAGGRQAPAQVHHQRRRLLQVADLGAGTGAAADLQREAQAVELARHRERAGARVERELERPQREGPVHARGGLEDGGGGRAEQRHLQPAVFLQLEAVVDRHHLPDGEADFLAAVVDASPLRFGAVAGQIGGQVRRRLEVRLLDERGHGQRPGRQRNPGQPAGHAPGQGANAQGSSGACGRHYGGYRRGSGPP